MSDLTMFAKRLKEAREKKGFTQRDLASKVSVTPASLSSYEKGNSVPSLPVVKELAEVCDVSIDWLCGGNDQSKIPETFSDVIRLLFLITATPNLESNINVYDNSYGNNYTAEISFTNEELITFFCDWEKMKKLHDDDSIDDEVYDLWIEKTLNKYNVNIKDAYTKKLNHSIPEGFDAIADEDIPF